MATMVAAISTLLMGFPPRRSASRISRFNSPRRAASRGGASLALPYRPIGRVQSAQRGVQVREHFLAIRDALLVALDLTGQRSAAILQGSDGVLVSFEAEVADAALVGGANQ